MTQLTAALIQDTHHIQSGPMGYILTLGQAIMYTVTMLLQAIYHKHSAITTAEKLSRLPALAC